MEQKKSGKITLVLLTAGALLLNVTGCHRAGVDDDDKGNASAGAIYQTTNNGDGDNSSYSSWGGYSHAYGGFHSSGFSSGSSRGGFGSSGDDGGGFGHGGGHGGGG